MIRSIDTVKCTGCGKCFSQCPLDVIRLNTAVPEVPPCKAACPAMVDIRGYMYLLKLGKLDEASRIIEESLPFPAITGRVCFHNCEAECARNEVDEPININALERFVGDYSLRKKTRRVQRQHVGKVAVVGSGPAGLSCAYFLITRGYPVTVFDSLEKPGGMLRIGIPGYRLPRKILEAQIQSLRDLGVEFVNNTTIGKDLAIEELREKGYKATLLAPGLQLSKKIDIPGIELNGVVWGLDFLEDVNLKRLSKLNGKVLVIGGGDVAMDVALSAQRIGAYEVEIACLEGKNELPSHDVYTAMVQDEGVIINYSTGIKSILGRERNALEAELIYCISVFDEDGAFNPSFDDKLTRSIQANMVILAIGQVSDLSLLGTDIEVKDRLIVVDPITRQTSVPDIFAGGDIVSGPSTVVDAIVSGRIAAMSIDKYLRNEKTNGEVCTARLRELPKDGIVKRPRRECGFLNKTVRGIDFREIKLGFSDEMAMLEADRCMTCGSKAYIAYNDDCMTCFSCELECPSNAIDVHPFKEVLPFPLQYEAGGKYDG